MRDLLVVLSTPAAGDLMPPLAAALARAGAQWACFATGQGVGALARPEVLAALQGAETVVACEHSWEREMGHQPCPVEAGSQFHHSDMLGETRRVLSL